MPTDMIKWNEELLEEFNLAYAKNYTALYNGTMKQDNSLIDIYNEAIYNNPVLLVFLRLWNVYRQDACFSDREIVAFMVTFRSYVNEI